MRNNTRHMRMLMSLTFAAVFFLIADADRLIRYPDFNKGVEYVGIDSVSINDTAAFFDVSFYHNHGWWIKLHPETKLIGGVTGKSYAIKSISGIELGEKTYVPFSGYIPAQISFEPLEPADTIVDFIEPDGWKIHGIKLYDTTKGKIKTNVSGTVDSDLVSHLWLFTNNKDQSMVDKFFMVPVREGRFDYDIYTDNAEDFYVVVGNSMFKGYQEIKLKQFKAEGNPVVINYDYEEVEYL